MAIKLVTAGIQSWPHVHFDVLQFQIRMISISIHYIGSVLSYNNNRLFATISEFPLDIYNAVGDHINYGVWEFNTIDLFPW